MRKNYSLFGVILGLVLSGTFLKAQVTTQTLNYTGSVQTLTINSTCPTPVTITCYGAQGANGASTASAAVGGTGGLGAMVSGIYTVAANGVLNIYVGGAGTGSVGGYNGGGNGGTNTVSSGAGGGASDIRFGGTSLANRIIVAGGGGGGGSAGCASSTITGGNGGAGGGGNGTAGLNSVAGGGGQGGSGTTGGAAGIGCSFASGTVGANGTTGIGGNGGNGPAVCGAFVSGGGGGGGFNGGGGGGGGTAGTTSCSLNDQGAGGGGAGGTNYFAAGFTNTNVVAGTRTGNGLVVISYSTINVPTLVVNPATQTVCSGSALTMTASGASTYSWSTGATTSVLSISNHTISTTYTAYGFTTTPGGTCALAPVVRTTTIASTPTITGTASTNSLCSGSSATLVGGGGVTYTWTGGVTNAVSFTPSTTQTYVVTGTGSTGCTSTAAVIITVVATPSTALTSGTPQVCANYTTPVVLTCPVGTGWTWLPGNATTNTIAVSPTVTTTYTCIPVNGACSFTSQITLTVNALPAVFALVNPTMICQGQPAALAAGGANTYTWSTGTGTLSGANVTVTPVVGINYTLTGSNGQCKGVNTVSLTVNPNPTIQVAVSASSVICLGKTVTLTANSTPTAAPATSFTWFPATSNSVTGTNSIVLTPTASISVPIIGTNTYACNGSVSQVVAVNPLPTINIVAAQNKTLVCPGFASTITASGANTYSWTGGPSTASYIVNPTTATAYTVTGTFTATQCNNTKTFTVNVWSPSVTITGPTSVCVGGTIVLVGGVNGSTPTYTWNGNYPFQTYPSSPGAATVYVLAATSTSNNVSCVGNSSVSISIYQNPTITAVSSRSAICRGEATDLIGGGGATYLWSSGQQGTTVTISPTVQSTYSVLGTDANGCIGTASLIIKVSPCTGLNEQGAEAQTVYVIPNPSNGEFTIQSDDEINVSVVNEIGQVIKHMVLQSGNNKISAGDLPNGVYYLVGEKNGNRVNQKIIIDK